MGGALQPSEDTELQRHHLRVLFRLYRTAALARTEARLDIRAWKEDANGIRLANYGELVAIAGRTDRKRDWADAFFLSAKTTLDDSTDNRTDDGAGEKTADEAKTRPRPAESTISAQKIRTGLRLGRHRQT